VKWSRREATATGVKTAAVKAAFIPGQSRPIINFFGTTPKILILQPSRRAAAGGGANT